MAVLSHLDFILHKGSQLPILLPFCKNHVYALYFFLALLKTGIALALIQLMHHPLTPLSGSRRITMSRYLSFPFLCFVLFHPHIPATNAVRLSYLYMTYLHLNLCILYLLLTNNENSECMVYIEELYILNICYCYQYARYRAM